MVLCTLINISLDISSSITWWLFKHTLYGTYSVGYYFIITRRHKLPENNLEKIKQELVELNERIALQESNNIILNTQINVLNINDTQHIFTRQETHDYPVYINHLDMDDDNDFILIDKHLEL